MNIKEVGGYGWAGAGLAVLGMVVQHKYKGWKFAGYSVSDSLYAGSVACAYAKFYSDPLGGFAVYKPAVFLGLSILASGGCLYITRYKDFAAPLIAVGANVMAWNRALDPD